MFEADNLRQALAALGAVLADRGFAYEIVAIGGGGLLLLGAIRRPTRDLDALALVESGEYKLASPLPPPLLHAIEDVARVLGLPPDWLNPGPTNQLLQGLPEGFCDRTSRHVFGGLTIQLAAQYDQICFKLYASADNGPKSKHFRDLIDLAPTVDELHRAREWVARQDANPEYGAIVDGVVAELERVLGLG